VFRINRSYHSNKVSWFFSGSDDLLSTMAITVAVIFLTKVVPHFSFWKTPEIKQNIWVRSFFSYLRVKVIYFIEATKRVMVLAKIVSGYFPAVHRIYRSCFPLKDAHWYITKSHSLFCMFLRSSLTFYNLRNLWDVLCFLVNSFSHKCKKL